MIEREPLREPMMCRGAVCAGVMSLESLWNEGRFGSLLRNGLAAGGAEPGVM